MEDREARDDERGQGSRVLRVADEAAARVLLDTRNWDVLNAFLRGPRRPSEVARQLGMPLSTLASRIRRYVALGLLEAAGVERRRGSPMTTYRTTAEHFFVPARVAGAATLESLLEATAQPFERLVRSSRLRLYQEAGEDWGLNIYRSDDGFGIGISPLAEVDRAFVARSLRPQEPAHLYTVLTLPFDFATAKELQRDLNALLRAYAARAAEGHQGYLVRVDLVPAER